jgi:hypothetical protein
MVLSGRFVVNLDTSVMVNFWPEHSMKQQVELAAWEFTERVRHAAGVSGVHVRVQPGH